VSRLQQQLAAGRFVVTAEIAPPKGVDLAPALAAAGHLDGLTAINVTDNQGANLRMSPLALAARLRQAGCEPVLQLTCRDRNRLALQSELLAAAALGVDTFLLLSGDHPRFGDHPQARPVFDLDAVQLLQAARRLGEGFDMADRPLQGVPQVFAGAAVSPASEPFELMFQKFLKKIEAGAGFFQTQAVFEPATVERFMDAATPTGAPVLLGVLLLRNAAMARFVNRHIPGLIVPDSVIDRLERSADPLREGVAIARDLVDLARQRCQGVHLMTLGRDEWIPAILGWKASENAQGGRA